MSSSSCLGNATLINTSIIPTTYSTTHPADDAPPKQLNSLSSSPSLKRTFSADMPASQKRMLPSFSLIKKTESSDHLDALAEDLDSNQEVIIINNEDSNKKGAFDDIWCSIISNKKNETGSGSKSDPPYVHPLVKRSASSLSEKSLEICTESLGSETGSDGLFSFTESGSEGSRQDADPNPEPHDLSVGHETKEWNYGCVDHHDQVVGGRFNLNYSKRVPPSSPTKSVTSSSSSKFPPPLPSLSHRGNLHMRSQRRDGRLVLEAVSLPSTTCLRALRHDGRLLLTLSSDDHYNNNNDDNDDDDMDHDYPQHEEDSLDQNDLNHDDDDDDDGGSYEQGKRLAVELVMEERSSCQMIMSKLLGSQKWRPRRTINATVIKDLDEETDGDNYAPPLTNSFNLPPLIPPTSTTLNAYEYYWRRQSDSHRNNSATLAVLKPLTAAVGKQPPQVVVTDENGNNKWVLGYNGNIITAQAHKEDNKGKETVVEKEYLLPFFKGCKEPRRPLLFLEPCCIATS